MLKNDSSWRKMGWEIEEGKGSAIGCAAAGMLLGVMSIAIGISAGISFDRSGPPIAYGVIPALFGLYVLFQTAMLVRRGREAIRVDLQSGVIVFGRMALFRRETIETSITSLTEVSTQVEAVMSYANDCGAEYVSGYALVATLKSGKQMSLFSAKGVQDGRQAVEARREYLERFRGVEAA